MSDYDRAVLEAIDTVGLLQHQLSTLLRLLGERDERIRDLEQLLVDLKTASAGDSRSPGAYAYSDQR
jgi:hypothetical protein